MVGKDETEIARAALSAEELGADLVELRLDTVEGLDREKVRSVFRLAAGVGLPKIATVMPRSIFGGFEGSAEELGELLLEASNRAEYVDVGIELLEGHEGILEKLSQRAKVVLSWHADRLLSIDEMRSFVRSWRRCSVYKIAMPAKSASDNLVALQGCLALEGFRRVVFCYGREGIPSRVISPVFGSEWAYAALRKGQETAPGQIDIDILRRIRGAFA